MNKINKNRSFASPAGIIALCVILLASLLIAVRMGSASLGVKEFFGGLFMLDGYKNETLIIYIARLPRVLGAALAGVGLSISGVLLQSITGNPLAGPNIIGVNAGAGFAVILMLLIAPASVMLTPFSAFAGAFLATLLIVSMASKIENSNATVILAGIAVTAMLNAGISFVSLLDTDVLSTYNYFSVGSLSGVTADRLPVPAVIIAVSLAASLVLSRRIDTLCLGDGVAQSLGVNVKRLRLICLVVASASAAAVVSYAGLLGFVGLVVPHISRRLVGSSVSKLLPVSAFVGAILVVTADLLGRVLFAPSQIPVGIIMALVGGPFFFRLLIKKKSFVSSEC